LSQDVISSSPLHSLVKFEKEVRAFGFDWPDLQTIIDCVMSECHEVSEALELKEPSHRVQEEIGDLLHTAISLCISAGYDIDETLEKTLKKFTSRMTALKTLTAQAGHKDLNGQSFDYMLTLWKEAKKIAYAGEDRVGAKNFSPVLPIVPEVTGE
jgi:uncharacterized protein YabN with tetrapyrrole methylase and pyrophosphatase domain